MPSSRICFFTGFILCLLAILVALYFQYIQHDAPCPLCVLQRVAVIGAGIVFLIAGIQGAKKTGTKVYAIILLVILIAGISVSLRQVWLQHLPPDQVPACGPGLNYLLQVMPWQKALATVLKGTGDCAVVHFRFLYLSIAGWTAVLFAILILLSLWQLFRQHR